MYLKVVCEGGEAMLFNPALPTVYHYIEVTKKAGNGKKGEKRTEKVYTFRDWDAGRKEKGEDWWMTCVYSEPPFYFCLCASS